MQILFVYLGMILVTTANAASHFGYHYAGNNYGHSNINTNNKNTKTINSTNSEQFVDLTPRSNSFFLPQTMGQQQQNQQSKSKQQQEKSEQEAYIGNKYLPPSETTANEPIISKQFFLVSAAEEDPEEPTQRTKHIIIGRPQKNYRVVFIKAPTSDNSNLKFTAEYAPQEEKTVIYVLSKKSNDLDIDEIATPAPTKPSKPEIFFIKYKTPEEAKAAQKEIQEQYDSLGGTSEFSDDGVVPIKSVIGSINDVASNGGYDYHKAQSGGDSSNLKPARFYF
ncbi:uncharacterized protein [Eurosta solidaginis]|uniref:uncharacterized protein n=1 Tax=Eurosta solidaginis TaxID=178769 RepID=UPI003530D3EA